MNILPEWQQKAVIFQAKIDSSAKAVLLYLRFYRDLHQDEQILIQEIAEKTGLNRKTVSRKIKELNRIGLMNGLDIDWSALQGSDYHFDRNPERQDLSYQEHRDFVFERDKHKCVYCGSGECLSLDHVIPRSRGGSHDADNLATCCMRCNRIKNARTPEEWLGGV